MDMDPHSVMQRVLTSENETVEVMAEHSRQILVVENEVVDLWRAVGSSQGLSKDEDISRFLLSLYFGENEERAEEPPQCLYCKLPLMMVCVNCGLAQPGQSLPQSSQHTHHLRAILQWPLSQHTSPLKASSQHVHSQQSVSQNLLPLANISPSPETNDYSDFSDMDVFDGAPADGAEALETDVADNANVGQDYVSTSSDPKTQIQILKETCHKSLFVALTKCDSQNLSRSKVHSTKVGISASNGRKGKECGHETLNPLLEALPCSSAQSVCDSPSLRKCGFPMQCDQSQTNPDSSTENSNESHELQKFEMLKAEREEKVSADRNAKKSSMGTRHLELLKKQRKCNLQNKQLKKTLALFMAGKMRIPIRKNVFTHYTCFKCYTVFESQKVYDAHRNRTSRTCKYMQEGKKDFDANDKEILTKIKEQYLVCCPHCDVVFIKKGERSISFEQHLLMHTSTEGNTRENNSSSQVEESVEDSANVDDTSLLEEDEKKWRRQLQNQTPSKYAIYGDFIKQWGAYSYYSSYTCSQCRKVFKLKRNFLKHMENASCDFDDDLPEGTGAEILHLSDVDTPRVKRQSALKVIFSEGNSLEESETENQEEETMDSEDRDWRRSDDFTPMKKKILSPSTLRKTHTLEEFMAGKYRIPLYVKGTLTIYSHYPCFKCNTIVETPNEIVNHRRGRGDNPCLNATGEHPPPRPEFDSRSVELLKRLKDELLLCCPFCNQVFIRRSIYKQHVLTHKFTVDDNGMHVCNVCSQIFPKYEQLYQHVAIPDGSQTCSVCERFFTSKCQISAHMANHPDNLIMIKCKVCGESVPKIDKRKHNQIHTDSNPKCICPHCGRFFSCKSALDQHMVVHNNDRPFSCKVCSKSFKYEYILRRHEVKHEEKKQQCEICGAKFHLEKELTEHNEKVHLNVRYPCDICKYEFKAKKCLTKHKQLHFKAKSFTCQECGLQFRAVHRLREHMRVHTHEKPFKCSFCSAKFGRKDYLMKHSRLHTGEKPFACGHCGQRFTCLSSYKYHIRKRHTEMLLTCSLCNVTCVDQKRLDYHMNMLHRFQVPVKDESSCSELGKGQCRSERSNNTSTEASSPQLSFTAKSDSVFDINALS